MIKYETFKIDSYLIVVTYHNNNSELLIEVKTKGESLFAINKGGSAHDGYSGVRIPQKVYQQLIKKFEGWKFTSNNKLKEYLK